MGQHTVKLFLICWMQLLAAVTSYQAFMYFQRGALDIDYLLCTLFAWGVLYGVGSGSEFFNELVA